MLAGTPERLSLALDSITLAHEDNKHLPCYRMFSNTRIYDSLQVHSLVEQAYLHKSYERWVLKQGLIR